MKKIILFEDGRFKHFRTFQDEFIEVSNEVAYELAQNPYTRKYDQQTKMVSDYIQPFVFADALAIKGTEITAAATQAFSVITALYLQEEIDSFKTQEEEALAWRADNAALTPILDGIVSNRPSVTKEVLVNRILDVNVPAYKAITGTIMGKKQHYEDLIAALKAQHDDPEQDDVTQDDIDQIVVAF